ncbi:MAG: ribosome biogenesis GTP-binding protein YihA/YsxC [Helicobacteraceae bacterium]|jgi:GTP-binding protein|nr:ribosome biogenesis GTP-binding protein YihA/YsxC [Helicobacteraceae bacterium]
MRPNFNVEAKFLTSATDEFGAPEPSASEIVFLGRSNVGKSSLLNALCQRKNLAKTSSAPGKTRMINYYEIAVKKDGARINLRFVDLPGFGYAKVSKTEREAWSGRLSAFLRKRRSIRLFLRLIDSRHADLPQDTLMSDFVRAALNPDQTDLAVYTKVDKLNRQERDALLRQKPDALLLSSATGEGLDKLWDRIIESIIGA